MILNNNKKGSPQHWLVAMAGAFVKETSVHLLGYSVGGF